MTLNGQKSNDNSVRRWVIGPVVWLLLGLLWVQARPLAAQPVQPQQAEQATVSSYLRTELAAAERPVTFLVILRDQADVNGLGRQARAAANDGSGVADPESRRHARAQALYAGLTAHARTTQAGLLAWLDAQGVAYRPFYIVNMVEVTGDAALVEMLRLRPEIDRIVANPRVAGVEQVAQAASSWLQPATLPDATAAPAFTYGLADANVPEVWAQGVRGQGIVVAGQDTGVEWTHPALRNRYRGWNGQSADHAYDWYDAWAGSIIDACAGVTGPCDDTGHGTHTLGTTVGTTVGEDDATAFGVAPDAQWIACRNMLGGVGTPASYATCFQFFLAPYPVGGDPFRDGRPDLAPHIINNSWGCPPFEGCDADSLRAVTAAMRAAGQLVVASAGNSGPACSTVNDPIAIYTDVLTVGAHGANGVIGSFSSRGPVSVDGSGLLKPDLTAPGVGVLSALLGGTLGKLSGTSMAAPHVAGAAALLWSAVPDLVGEPERTIQLLIKSTEPVMDGLCTDAAVAVSPNPTYGYGRLDVAAALRMAQSPWHVAVQVDDGAGTPIDGATVTWIDTRTGYTQTATTTFDGTARFAWVYNGAYTLRVAYGSEDTGKRVETATIDLADDAGEVEGTARAAALSVAYYALRTAPPVEPYRYYFPLMGAP